jgi:hypothetical protein
MTREQWKIQYRRQRAEQSVQNLPGHGHARHGYQTTIVQQMTRVRTGIAPDGIRATTSRATRFDSPEAELEAIGKARKIVAHRVANGQISYWDVDPRGVVRPHWETVVVDGRRGGYGSGIEVQRDPSTGIPLPGRPVQPTGQDKNARVRLQYNPATGTWDPLTQYPTNEPVTP